MTIQKNTIDSVVNATEQKQFRLRKQALELRQLEIQERDASRPYLLRNPQIFTAFIATLGALAGIWITVQTGYVNKIKETGNLVKENAEARKREADDLTRKANEEMADATRKEDTAKTITAIAAARVAKARGDIDKARHDVQVAQRDANEATASFQHEIFVESMLPSYVYDQRMQLVSLTMGYHFPKTLGWLKGTRVSDLQIGSLPTLETDRKKLLASIPSSVTSLSLSGLMTSIDVKEIAGVQNLKSLDLGTGGIVDVLRLAHVDKAESLERLSIRAINSRSIELDGLGNGRQLNEMVLVPGACCATLSENVLKRLVSIYVAGRSGDRHVTAADLNWLQRAPHLRSIYFNGVVVQASVTPTVTILNRVTNSHLGPNKVTLFRGYAFPNIKSLSCSLETLSDATLIYDEFPNLAMLSLNLSGQWTQGSLVTLLGDISANYPRLKALGITGRLESSDKTVVVPSMPALDSLAINLEAFAVTGPVGTSIDLKNDPQLKVIAMSGRSLRRDTLSTLNRLQFIVMYDVNSRTIDYLAAHPTRLRGIALKAGYGGLPDDPKPKGLSRFLDYARPQEVVLDNVTETWLDHLPSSVSHLSLSSPFMGLTGMSIEFQTRGSETLYVPDEFRSEGW